MTAVVISGVIAGMLYALMGAGLVLVYRQSGVLNFAHGATGTLAAYVAYSCLEGSLGYVFAVMAAFAVGIALSVTIEGLVIRRLAWASDFTVAIATLGVALIVMGAVTAQWGTTPVTLRHPVQSSWSLQLGSVSVGADQLFSAAMALLVFLGLHVLVERTRFGLAMRAASEGPVTAGMLGIDVARVRFVTWAIAGALSTLAALLIVPQHYLDPNFLTAFMITAFAAIVLGGLESIGGALLGGLVFGVGSSLLSYYVTGRLTATVSFLAIIGVLALFPHGLFGRRTQRVVEPSLRRARRSPLAKLRRASGAAQPRSAPANSAARSRRAAYLRWGLATAAIAVLYIAVLVLPRSRIYELAAIAAIFPAVLGQNLVSGYGGQASIGQSGFMVAGAYVAMLMVSKWSVPLVIALGAGVVVAGLVAVLLAVAATRLSGVYLALVTISFALAMPELASFPESVTGGALGLTVESKSLAGIGLVDTGTVYVVLLTICLALGLVFWLAASGSPGRRWRAVRDSEPGAASIGIPVRQAKIWMVALGGGLAGLAGVLSAQLVGFLAPDQFTLWTSVYLLAAVIVGGSSSILGTVLGAAFITVVPIETASLPELTQIIFGAAILAAVTLAPQGLAQIARQPLPRPGTDGDRTGAQSDVSGGDRVVARS
jgi:branched-subunit amino acid ABC-type transport system permease component